MGPLGLLKLLWAAPAGRGLRAASGAERVRLGAFALGTLFFVLVLFNAFKPVTQFLWNQEELGPLLSARLVTVVFSLLFLLLFISALLAFLSRFFSADDAPLFIATPVDPSVYFEFRLWQTLLGTAWMILPVWLPYLLALRRAMHVSYGMVAWGLLAPWPLAVIACALAGWAACGISRFLPPKKARRWLGAVAVVLGLGSLWLLRGLRPETLADPERAKTVANYIGTLNALEPDWWPPSWAGRAVMRFNDAPAQAIGWWLLGALLAWSLWRGLVRVFGPKSLDLWLANEAGQAQQRQSGAGSAFLFKGRPRPWRWLLQREALALWRVRSQRMQALFLASLVAFFSYNLARLPLGDDADLRQYLFVPVCAFTQLILVSVAARFIFPAGSLERPGAWLLFSAPVPSAEHIKAKLALFGGALALLSVGLGWAVWRVFLPTSVALWAGCLGFVVLPWGLASLNLGLGIYWARTDASTPDEVVSSPAGVLVMIMSSFFVLGHALLMALPLYEAGKLAYMPKYEINYLAVGVSLAFWLLLQVAALWWPLRLARRRIEGLV
jgi:ABC-2 type transport system permease protein